MFITIEGIDGSGKTTIIKMLEEYISTSNCFNANDFVFTREPGGKNALVAEKIRTMILDKENNIDPLSEALLYLVSRNIHINNVIKPALEQKKIIICDRYVDSSIAYQGHARGLGMDKIKNINNLVVEDTMPNYTFYFKIDPEISLKRIMEHSPRELDRLEKENINFFEKVKEGYDIIANENPKRIIVIDANQDQSSVFKDFLNQIKLILNQK